MSKGQKRLGTVLRRLWRGGRSSVPPEAHSSGEAWTQFKIRQLELRQQWIYRLLWLVVVGVLARWLGLDDVFELIRLVF